MRRKNARLDECFKKGSQTKFFHKFIVGKVRNSINSRNFILCCSSFISNLINNNLRIRNIYLYLCIFVNKSFFTDYNQ